MLPTPRRRPMTRPRIRDRATLIGVALALQAVVLVAAWWTTFTLVRTAFARSVEQRIVDRNAELANRVIDLLPSLMRDVDYGSDEWNGLQNVIEGLTDLPAGGFACVLDADGNILCHPDIREEQSLRQVNLGDELIHATATDADAAPPGTRVADLSADEIVGGRIDFRLGDTHYVATRTVPGTDLRLLVHQPVNQLVQAGQASTRIVLLVAGIALFAVLGLTGFGLTALIRSYDSEIESVNRRLRGELSIARDIQQATLPVALPQADGWLLRGWSEPAEETGGDTFDAFTCSDGRIMMLLADATGHGVGPALAVTALRAQLRALGDAGLSLDELAGRLNHQLHEDLPVDKFITAWFGRLDPVTGGLESFAAGQGPVFIQRAGQHDIETRPADTWPLGVMETLGGDGVQCTRLMPGDTLLVLSDGIIEAREESGQDFGDEGVRGVMRDVAATRSGMDLADALRDAVTRVQAGRPPADDMTVLTIHRDAAALA
ncbi:MAG: PP2C family protein-serine/threonine phosphatase [Phycisphaerales bacterium]